MPNQKPLLLKPTKTKLCSNCQVAVQVAFRIRIQQDQQHGKNWRFVCKGCCQKLAVSDGYQYGGTWKGTKK